VNKGKLSLTILAVAILAVSIGQYSFIMSNQSSLIWSHDYLYDLGYSNTGSESTALPPTTNDYLLVFKARHMTYSQWVTILDITFLRIETLTSYNYHIVVESTTIATWYTESKLVNISPGEYNLSWTFSADYAYVQILVYKNGIFNGQGDPYYNVEKGITIFSGIILYLCLFGTAIITYKIFKKNPYPQTSKEKKKKLVRGTQKPLVSKIYDSTINSQLEVVKAISRGVAPIKEECPHCLKSLLLGQNKCFVCGRKFTN